MNKDKAVFLVMLCISLVLTGCSAVSTAVKKRNLDVKTQMSETIWLEPVSAQEKTVFLQIRNTTDKKIDLVPDLMKKLSNKGYTVVDNPDTAHYWLQANVLKLDKMDLNQAQGFFSSGYGSALGGAAVGALALASTTNNSNSIIAGGLVGGAISFLADSLVEDVNYTMITDVLVVEKTKDNITTTESANIKNGSASQLNTTVTTTDNKRRFQTRIMSNANQVNLTFEEAEPTLIDSLTTSISGVF